MPDAEPAQSPLQPIEELDRRDEPGIYQRPEHHHTPFCRQCIHEDMQVVRDQADQEPQPEIGTIDAMENACHEERDWDCEKKAVGKIIVIPLHISEKDCWDHIQIGQHGESRHHDHLQRDFPTLNISLW